MSRFVLRYAGGEAMPADHLNSIRLTPGLRIIDESPKMLLVDSEESTLQKTLKEMPGWSLHPEQTYSIPDTRKRLA
jgi:hypothetical protein